MQSLGIIIFCLAVVHPLLCYGEENPDVDPILEYLQMRTEDVIDHELVHINTSKHMQKRAFGDISNSQGTEMRFRAFGGDVNLWLYPRDSLLASTETPVYFAFVDIRKRGGVRYELQVNAMKRLGEMLEDPGSYATFFFGSDPLRDQHLVTGYMRNRRDNTALVIRPLPQEVVERHLRRRRSIDANAIDSSLDSARHVVLKVKDFFPKFDMGQDLKKVNVRGNTSRPLRSVDANNIDYSHSIYPKIFVQLDSTYWNNPFIFGQSDDVKLQFLLTYTLAFWNGVDLAYRHLENPNVRLHISGIAVSRTPKATPFIDIARQPDGVVDSGIAINGQKNFFYAIRNQISLDTYNIAVTMTGLNLENSVHGIASVGAACFDSSFLGTKEAVILVHDGLAFDGISTGAHELGHSFGVRHDDESNSAACSTSLGYIMAGSTRPTEKSFSFSPCSLEKFNQLLRQGSLRCLSNPPQNKLGQLPKLLPGNMLDLDTQCKMLNYEKRCGISKRDPCIRLSCTTKDSNDYYETCDLLGHGAAPGTPCGDTQDGIPRFCVSNQCVPRNVN